MLFATQRVNYGEVATFGIVRNLSKIFEVIKQKFFAIINTVVTICLKIVFLACQWEVVI